MTTRNIAKSAANFAVYSGACTIVENTVDNYTDYDPEDNLAIRVGCYVVALYATKWTKPIVNDAVDKIADRWIARKEMRATKKMEESVAAAA